MEAIFNLIKEETIKQVLSSFYECINLPVSLMDNEGNVLLSFGETYNYCKFFENQSSEKYSCEQMLLKASVQAIEYGEAYVFSCHAHLNHIVYPLTMKKTFVASIIIGPFLLSETDSLMFEDIAQKYNLDIAKILELHEYSYDIPIVSPKKINCINTLLHYIVGNLSEDSKLEQKYNNDLLLQQSKISDAIQQYKNPGVVTVTYPYKLENKLLTKVRNGNMAEARDTLNELLGYLFQSQGNSFYFIQARALELCSLLSRAAIEGGASSDLIMKLNTNFLEELQKITEFEPLCLKLQEVVDSFSERIFSSIDNGTINIINPALQYISSHYSEDLTLDIVAKQVHLNPTYFSFIFKAVTKYNFKEYLNRVRIEESKLLLKNTQYSIIDIATSCGFEDQSYFTKVFKKVTGITPKQFR